MIKGGKIRSVHAERMKDGATKGLNINIGIDKVSNEGNKLTIEYTYSAKYEDKVGELTIKGQIYAEEEKAVSIQKEWADTKKLPEAFAELVLNTINYTCGTNGTLVVRTVNLSPPMIPPRISLSKGQAQGKA